MLNKEIFLTEESINIKIEHLIPENIITSEEMILKNLNDDFYYIFSGGGSIIFQDRYLLISKRTHKTLLNQDKYSLFTGRSDNIKEIINPKKLIRELKEELKIEGYINLYLKNYKILNSKTLNLLMKKLRILIFTESLVKNSREIKVKIESFEKKIKNNFIVAFNELNEINLIKIYNSRLNLFDFDIFYSENNVNKSSIYVFDLEKFILLDFKTRKVIFQVDTPKLQINRYVEPHKNFSSILNTIIGFYA